MAENKVVITTEVKTGESINSLKKLKQELKEAQAAALNGDGKAAKRVAELKDRMEDLSDSVKTLKGSGVERASASFGQLGEGLRNFDFDKIKTGFKGIGSAMAAIPIFLIVEGITYLIENFKELSQGNGILAKSLRAVGDVISWVVDKVYALTDALGLTNSELDKQGEAIKKNADDTKEALDRQTAAFDRQIKAAQAAGKSTVELEKAKQQAIIDTNLQVVKQIEAFVRAGGELDDEKKRLLTASLEAIKTAKNEENVIEIKADQDKKKRDEDAFKRLQEKHEKERAELQKQQELALKAAKDEDEWQEASLKYLTDKEALATKQKIEYAELEANAKASLFNDTVVAGAKSYDEDVAAYKKAQELKQQLNKTSFDAAQGLSQAFFAFQLNAAKGNAAKELEVKKKAFQVDKAFNLARAVMDGISATNKALAAGGGVPAGIPFAVATAALSAANVAKILASKFDAGTTPDSSAANSTPINTSAPTALPQVSNTTVPNVQSSTSFDESGKNLNNRVYVVESDITKAQGRVARLNEQATI